MSIITNGLGSDHIITGGYGKQPFLVQWMLETVDLEEQIYKKISKSLSDQSILYDQVSRTRWIVFTFAEALNLSDTVERLWTKLVLELAPKAIRRFIPYRYVPFEKRFVLEGSLKAPTEITKEIVGSPLFKRKEDFAISGNLKAPLIKKTQVQGNPKFQFGKTLDVQGHLLRKFERPIIISGGILSKIILSLPVSGSLKSKLEKVTKIKGKKDFKKVIWEILEPENGNGE